MSLQVIQGVRPRLLDLFCGAGGASKGYHTAGFEVVGVDIVDQPHYPFDFVQGDCMKLSFKGFDAIHASPPCQRFSHASGKSAQYRQETYPDLLRPTRDILRRAELPYVIENVENAPLYNPIKLCGTLFPDLRVLKHRLFEVNFPVPQPDLDCFNHPKIGDDGYVTVAGGLQATLLQSQKAMKIDWMNSEELSQAIPPDYTEFIGKFLKTWIS